MRSGTCGASRDRRDGQGNPGRAEDSSNMSLVVVIEQFRKRVCDEADLSPIETGSPNVRTERSPAVRLRQRELAFQFPAVQ